VGEEARDRILLGARVPSRPHTAVGLGMDGVRWAKEGLIDMLVPCPFWATIEFDIPIEEWKRELSGTNVILAPVWKCWCGPTRITESRS
jgi:hypothetical protein